MEYLGLLRCVPALQQVYQRKEVWLHPQMVEILEVKMTKAILYAIVYGLMAGINELWTYKRKERNGT